MAIAYLGLHNERMVVVKNPVLALRLSSGGL